MCLGCGRLLAEILQWAALDSAARRQVCAQSMQRLQAAKQAHTE
ncbi:DUF1289 domain-containing protein [Ectopseudomonas mendocina]|uniref:DUF1289 domain-containing protein n=1 Tax=Ectopseudomonas mendocina TaxID=300 RepID=A0ABZ2RK47_ECTME